MLQIENIGILLRKYFNKELAPWEKIYLEGWLNRSNTNQQLFDEICLVPDLMDPVAANDEISEAELAVAWEKLKVMGWKRHEEKEIKKINFRQLEIAAVIMGIIFLGILFWQKALSSINGWQPVSLTLGNGQIIPLNGSRRGVVATQDGIKVILTDSALQYHAKRNYSHKAIYNKVTVPPGNDVMAIQLSDGSKVWLNGGSSIKYPVVFTKGEREVEMTGEAYFEICSPVHSLRQSSRFVVSNGNLRVTVRGARFNVNMNASGGPRVTLVEGSVNMKYINEEQTINAGQQAVVDYKTIALVCDVNVDINSELAWRNK